MSRKRKRKSNYSRNIVLSICFILIGIGILLASRSSDGNIISSGFPSWRSDSTVSKTVRHNDSISTSPQKPRHHFPALETVAIPDGVPQQTKEYIGFTISFNKENHTPNYVAWELLGEESKGTTKRNGKFWTDSDIEGCPDTRDYSRSGYDRGHMCPSGDQKWSQEAMDDCFVMANICPQDRELNQKAWKTLENKERQWARRDSAIMIIAGPIYEKTDTKRIGKAGVRVPSAFFKVLLAPYVEEPRGIAFVYPNMPAPGNMQDYAMSIDDLEEITGFDFFPSLPDDIEEKLESSYSFKEWNSSRKLQ